MKKSIIWSDLHIDIDDWRDGYAEHCEINQIDPGTDFDIYNWAAEMNAEYLDDERANLNRQIDGNILAIADVGRWNGRFSGYVLFDDHNLNGFLNILDDMTEFYGDGREIRATGAHHDGRNYYLFRATRPGRDIDKLLTAIYHGEYISPQKLNYYTRSIYNDVATVYGWRD